MYNKNVMKTMKTAYLAHVMVLYVIYALKYYNKLYLKHLINKTNIMIMY